MYFISVFFLLSFCSCLKVCGDEQCICDLETIHCTDVVSFPRFSSTIMTHTRKIVIKDSWVGYVDWDAFPNLQEIEIINTPFLCVQDDGKYIITGCKTRKYCYFIFPLAFLDFVKKDFLIIFFQFQDPLQNRRMV